MRAEILVGLERRRRWTADDKLQIVREGRLDGWGGEVVGFVPVGMPLAPGAAPNDNLSGTDSFSTGSPIEIGLPGGRSPAAVEIATMD